MNNAVSDAVVILGGVPYERTANQTSLHMFDALGRAGVLTLYVSRAVQRRSLGIGRSQPAHQVRRGLVQVGTTSWVLTLPKVSDALPMTHPAPARKLQIGNVRWQLRRALSALGMERPRLLTYWWMFPEIVGDPVWRDRTFDVIDRHWGYEHLSEARSNVERDLALRTAKASDKTVAVSEGLANELTELRGRKTEVLQNGVDLLRVQKALAKTDGFRRSKSALYCGGWNARIDEDLVKSTVARNPDWTFDFIGGGTPQWLRRFENVRDFGQLDYDSAVALMSSAQVGLVPFRKTEYTDASNFLKVLDYLAAGMTVLGTDLPTLREADSACSGQVVVASSPVSWHRLGELKVAERTTPSTGRYLVRRSTDNRLAKLMNRV